MAYTEPLDTGDPGQGEFVRLGAGRIRSLALGLRQRLESVFVDADADPLVLQPDTVNSSQIAAGAVQSAELADLNVITSKLADLAVTNPKLGLLAVAAGNLQDLAVTAAKLGLLSVNTGNLIDLAVTNAKLALLSVASGNIQDLSIIASKLADDAVITQKIINGAVTNPKLGLLSVATGTIQDDAVTAQKIAANAVDTSELAPLGVTTPKLADGAVTIQKLVAGAGLIKLYTGSLLLPATGGGVGANTLIPVSGTYTSNIAISGLPAGSPVFVRLAVAPTTLSTYPTIQFDSYSAAGLVWFVIRNNSGAPLDVSGNTIYASAFGPI